MTKSEMIITITREAWLSWANLEELKWNTLSEYVVFGKHSIDKLYSIAESRPAVKSALDQWFAIVDLADKLGVDWLNDGYNSNDQQTQDAVERQKKYNDLIWSIAKK